MPGNRILNGLERICREKCGPLEHMSIPDPVNISDGWENEVYSFTVECGETSKRQRYDLILRIYPGDGASHKATREFSGMARLHRLGFPVPEVFMLELDESYFGKPFIIMEKINGRKMGTVVAESSGEKQQELMTLFCKILVDLHALDWRQFATELRSDKTEVSHTSVDRALKEIQRYIEYFQIDEFSPTLDWLRERNRDITSEYPSVIHFDYHPNNILLQKDGRAFVVDWTNIDVADFRLDLAWTILLTSTYGNPEVRQTILDEYERISGRKLEQIEYFEVMACLRRLLIITISLKAGADKLGMRQEAVTGMKQNADHIESVYAFMCGKTGINIPKTEMLISGIS